LWTANEDGSNLVRLTRGTGRMIGGIHWSPDGRWIIYDGQQADGHWDIWRIDSAGGQAEAITPPVSDEVIPSWSRDGRWIYFSSNRSGRSEVWRVPAGGGESLQITREGGVEPLESWDRKCLYYRRGSRLIERVLASGAERQLLEAVPLSSYTVTSRGIYHVVRPGNIRVPGFEIRLLDPASAKDHLLHKSELYGVQGLTVSPDGKTILYIATATRNIDLMLVENFR
jgi:WD40 repeat protein